MSKHGSMFRAVGLLFASFFGVSLLAGQAPSALVRPAAAYSCASPARFDVYPADGEVAPRNTRVVVVAAPDRPDTAVWARAHGLGEETSLDRNLAEGHDAPRIVLRADADGRAEVPTSAEQTAAGDSTTIVLSPLALLEANRAYSVSSGDDAIGHFRTNAEIDREAPRWAGVTQIETYPCGDGYPPPFSSFQASLRPQPAVDPGHPASQLLYALFADQSKTPFLYLRPDASGSLSLRGGDSCLAGNVLWSAAPFDLTIRAADTAGNFSAPGRYSIDLRAASGIRGACIGPQAPTLSIESTGRDTRWTTIAAAVLVLSAAYGAHRYRRARARREATYTL